MTPQHQTINNNINIINNITCNRPSNGGVNLFSTTTSDENINNIVSNSNSLDDEVIHTMTKLGLTADEVKKYINEGNDSYLNAMYNKVKGEKKVINTTIYPSNFVPSILSSFAHISKAGSIAQNNWLSGVVLS